MSSHNPITDLRDQHGFLEPEAQTLVRRAMTRPGVASWMAAKGIAITSWGMKLPDCIFCLTGLKELAEDGVPDPFTIRAAVVWATQAEAAHDREVLSHGRPQRGT